MCESCMRKLSGKQFVNAYKEKLADFRYCARVGCLNEATFVMHLSLPEKKGD